MRTIDEHTKLARVAVDFTPVLDSAFGINISKAIVKIPNDLRDKIKPVIEQVSRAADHRYRKSSRREGVTQPPQRGNGQGTGSNEKQGTGNSGSTNRGQGNGYSQGANELDTRISHRRQAIEAAADATGEKAALKRIIKELKASEPGIAHDLGW